jgi:hypothetical protein
MHCQQAPRQGVGKRAAPTDTAIQENQRAIGASSNSDRHVAVATRLSPFDGSATDPPTGGREGLLSSPHPENSGLLGFVPGPLMPESSLIHFDRGNPTIAHLLFQR